MVIKISLGKLHLAEPFNILIPEQLTQNGFELVDIKLSHLSELSGLPFHHRDPFDRLLISQATTEEMSVISGDVNFDLYGVNRIW